MPELNLPSLEDFTANTGGALPSLEDFQKSQDPKIIASADDQEKLPSLEEFQKQQKVESDFQTQLQTTGNKTSKTKLPIEENWQIKLQKEVGNTGEPITKGNLDPYHRPIYKHPNDEGYGTTYSMSFEDEDGSNVLIPQIVNGKLLSKDQAISHYRKTGENFGKFKTWQDADKYAEALHNSQDSYLKKIRPDLYQTDSSKIEEGDPTLPSLEEFAHNQEVRKIQAQKQYKKIEISGADVIHHLGLDPSIVGKLNPSLRAKLISEVSTAVAGDKQKRAEGQTEFPVNIPYQNSMRKRIGLSQMKTDMEAFTAPKDSNSDTLTFGNHRQFPIIYNIASTKSPETQELYKDNLIAAAKDRLRTGIQNTQEGAGFDDEAEISRQAEQEANAQLIREEQQRLDSASSTAYFTSSILGMTGFKSGSDIENISRGFARTVVGGSLRQLGNIQSFSPVNFGIANWTQRIGREIQAGAEENSQQSPTTTTFQAIRKGVGEGIGASPEILKLFAGAEILKAAELPELLNLPIQGAISRSDEGVPGIVKGIGGGLVYSVGGQLTANLGRVGNSLLWIAGPAAEAHLIGGQDLATAIGENIPMGLFIGATTPKMPTKNGAERVLVNDPDSGVRQATTEDLDGIAKKRLQLVPPTFRVTVPITDAPTFNQKFGILENQRGIVAGTYVPSYESPTNKYGEGTTQIEPNLETGFQARGEGQTVKLSLERAALNWLDLGRAIQGNEITNAPQKDSEVGYRNEANKPTTPVDLSGDSLASGLSKQQAAANAYDLLGKQIPEEVKDFVSKNEDAVRTNLKKNGELDAKRAELVLLRQKEVAVDSKKTAEMDKTIGNKGAFNREEFVDRVQAYDATQEVLNLFTGKTMIKPGGNQGGFINVEEVANVLKNKAVDLAKIVSFHIEDLYHRGIDADYSTIMNRLATQLPQVYGSMNEGQKHEWYNLGYNYWQSNNADPFFSKMKMDVTEKLPNRMDATQAKNILRQHDNEYNWTVGLKEFLADKELKGQKIDKKELIDVIQKGQVRVEASVASDKDIVQLRKDRLALRQAQKKLGDELETMENVRQINELENQIDAIDLKISNSSEVKYSLKAYTGEKLELPGAVNSKEVKLMTTQSKLDEWDVNYVRDPSGDHIDDVGQRMYGWVEDGNESNQIYGPSSTNPPQEHIRIAAYNAPHWDEPNVVAHYRSNDRTTTDGKRINFSEEFQSDWNHDIRERGVRLNLTKENYEAQGFEMKIIKDNGYGNPVWGFGKKGFDNTNYSDMHPVSKFPSYEEIPKEEVLKQFLNNYKQDKPNMVEPNPFMAHNWKELILKRFIRDSIVAKDENGNYKYEGIGWTTARQQQVRNGGVLEGKNFKWQKNSDGTYTFGFNNRDQGVGFQEPHELRNISLERFAELTTKEAAEEVRSQESKYEGAYWTQRDVRRLKTLRKWLEGVDRNDYGARKLFAERDKLIKKEEDYHTPVSQGKFSLKEAVELRSGIGKYSDYDVALVNMAKKIGKRFGASYSTKELPLTYVEVSGDDAGSYRKFLQDMKDGKEVYGKLFNKDGWNKLSGDMAIEDFYKYNRFKVSDSKVEKIHYLEITPSMRDSLSKEGFSLYGLGGTESLKLPEQGVRNRITTSEIFNESKNSLVAAIAADSNLITKPNWSYDNVSPETVQAGQERILNASGEDLTTLQNELNSRKGTVLNSGLSPEAFLDQTQLLYKGIKDFTIFTKELITRFGEAVRPYLMDLWQHVQDFHNDERGFIDVSQLNPRNLTLKTEAAKEYLKDPEKHQSDIDIQYTMRGIALSQSNPEFARPYNTMRKGQRATNSFESFVLDNAREGNKSLEKQDHNQVGEVLHQGIENQITYSRSELLAGDPTTNRPALNAKQADAYESLLKAQAANLDIRRETILYSYRERAFRLNERLNASTPGSPEEADILHQMGELSDRMDDVRNYYTKLKNGGYISLQRKGDIAAYIEDSAGVPQYQQFESRFAADKWIKEHLDNGANPATQSMYDIRNISDFSSLAKKLSPAAFEDLVESSGAVSTSPEIEKLRDEVYSQFPTQGYQLKREFVAGYERTWERALSAVIDQTEKYGSSFYSKVSGNEAMKELAATGTLKSDPNIYQIAKAYIEDEISAPESTKATRALGRVRSIVSYHQLAWDFGQFYLNAVGQPITQTYNYFARLEHPVTGERLKGADPEKYFVKGFDLGLKAVKGSAIPEFQDIFNRLVKERVVEPEFVKSLLETETSNLGQNIGKAGLKKFFSLSQQQHWASVFMRAGEKITRSQAAAEGFLVGKEKFGLSGEKLVDFIVQAVDATQSNPTKGENPYIVRRAFGANAGSREAGKLVYQFSTFNHMWMENFALNLKSDIKNKNAGATARSLYPLLIIGGLGGLPLSNFAKNIYSFITKEDFKKEADKVLGKDTLVEELALNGITTSAALGGKLTPSIPVLDTGAVGEGVLDTIEKNIPLPVVSTATQIAQGFDDLLKPQTRLRGVGEILPRAIRGPVTSARYYNEGIRNRDRSVILPQTKVTIPQLIGQGINITPNRVIENSETKKAARLKALHIKLLGRH